METGPCKITRRLTVICSMVSRILISLCFSMAVTGAAPHPSLPGPKVPDGLGVNIHFTDPTAGEMEMLAAAGFRWVRMDFIWQNTERKRAIYDFSAYDRLVGHLTKHGIKALFILDYGNPLYEKDSSVQTEVGRRAYARWAAAAVKHYQNRGFLWEFWNEPNIGFWKPKPDVDAYAAMARTAATAIRESAPGEALIGPATSGIDIPFIEACFKNGVLTEWDAVSVHPYRQNNPESVLSEYGKLRQSIRRAAPASREIPIISGEWGYSAAWQNLDENQQGRLLARQFLTNLSQGIPLSIWYDWRDDGADPKEPEHHFGTVGLPQQGAGNAVLRIKPAYQAARALTGTLAGHHFIRRLAIGAADDWVLLFGNERNLVVACWTSANEARTILLPVDEEVTCQYRNHLGEDTVPLTKSGDSIEVPLDAAPRYLRFDKLVTPLMEYPAPPDFTCDLVRAPGGVFLALVDNPTGGVFNFGSFSVTGYGGIESVPFALAAGETSKQVPINIHWDGNIANPVGLRVWRNHKLILSLPARRYQLGDIDLLSRCLAKGDGDPKVASTQSIETAKEVPPLPGFNPPVWKITCRFDPGWRFSTIEPQGERPIPGHPSSFGLWVLGDASGVGLRLRVRDANGRTWQPDGGSVSWRGWHHVGFSLNSGTAHWGGQGDGAMAYPLRWEAPVLIDNLSKKTLAAKLWVTAPTLVE